MKKLIFVLLTLALAPISSPAKKLPLLDRALEVQSDLRPTILNIRGVNGIGIAGCDPYTGEVSLEGNFVACVEISTDNAITYKKIQSLYPVGTQIRGVFIVVKNGGVSVPQPRMSVGG